MPNPSASPNEARPKAPAAIIAAVGHPLRDGDPCAPQMGRSELRAREDYRAAGRQLHPRHRPAADARRRRYGRSLLARTGSRGRLLRRGRLAGEYLDHLFRNEPLGSGKPGYAGWRGPYLKRVENDPWFRAYMIVAYPLNSRDGFADGRQCVVVSAGPNGRMDGDYSSPRDPVPAGDDLLEVVPIEPPPSDR
jgi:hypothetical protein